MKILSLVLLLLWRLAHTSGVTALHPQKGMRRRLSSTTTTPPPENPTEPPPSSSKPPPSSTDPTAAAGGGGEGTANGGTATASNGDAGATSTTFSAESSSGSKSFFDASSSSRSKAGPVIGVVGALAAGCSFLVAAVLRQRRRERDANAHPLKGSIQKRIQLFAMLAKDNKGTRAATDAYQAAPEAIV